MGDGILRQSACDSSISIADCGDLPTLSQCGPWHERTRQMNRHIRARPGYLLLALAFIGFISLGLPDAVIGVAWPSVRDTFHLRQDAVGMVLVISGVGYLLSSFFAGRLMLTFGIGLVLAVSTGLVAAAMFGFGFSPMWLAFLLCSLVHGLGSGAIDSGLNGYAAHHMSARQMIWLHACYCFGALIGPIVMSTLIASGRHYSAGYSAVGGTMLAMSIMFLITCRSWGESSPVVEKKLLPVSAGVVLRHSMVWIQMAVFFLYTGLEVTFSQWTFTVLTESRSVSPEAAGIAVGVYWGSIGIGRVVSGFIADRIGIDRLLRFCLIGAGSGALLFAARLPVEADFVGLAFAGLGLAPVFPCLMSRTPQRLGTELSTHAIGFQIGAAMIGAAAVPGMLGVIAGMGGLEAVPIGAVVLFGVLTLLHEALIRIQNVAANQCDSGFDILRAAENEAASGGREST
jgi:fucose permease